MKSRIVTTTPEVTCDRCGGKIILKPENMKSKHFPDGIYFDYFACDHCSAKYVTLVTDPNLRKDIKRRGFFHSASHMKLRSLELKCQYADRVKELP